MTARFPLTLLLVLGSVCLAAACDDGSLSSDGKRPGTADAGLVVDADLVVDAATFLDASGSASSRDAASSEVPTDAAPSQPAAGRLWRRYAPTDGTALLSLEGAPWRRVTSEAHDVHPTPDGSRFASALPTAAATRLTIVDTESLRTLFEVHSDEYVLTPLPSPTAPNMLLGLARPFSNTTSGGYVVLYDLSAVREVSRSLGLTGVAWLPDGRWLGLSGDGTLTAHAIDGTAERIGGLTLPSGTRVAHFAVNAQGTRLAIGLVTGAERSGDRDIWVADIDGSHLERFTQTTQSSRAWWSPDGNHLAFESDPDTCGLSTDCFHSSCVVYVAAASARNVRVGGTPADPLRFYALREDGARGEVRCFINGWSR